MKKLLSLTLAVLMVLSMTVMAAPEGPFEVILGGEMIYLEGQEPANDYDVILEAGVTYLPVKSLEKVLGLTTTREENLLIIHRAEESVTFDLEDDLHRVKNDEIYVPARTTLEHLDYRVDFDSKNNVAVFGDYTDQPVDLDKYPETVEEKGAFKFHMDKNSVDRTIVVSEDNTLIVKDKLSVEKNPDIGVIYTIMTNGAPQITNVPGYLLDYKDGKYIEAIYASDVQTSPRDPKSVESYNTNKELSKDYLRTFELID